MSLTVGFISSPLTKNAKTATSLSSIGAVGEEITGTHSVEIEAVVYLTLTELMSRHLFIKSVIYILDLITIGPIR